MPQEPHFSTATFDRIFAAHDSTHDSTDKLHPCDWRFFSKAEREQWRAEHLEDVALAAVQARLALNKLAVVIKRTGAAERRNFAVAEFCSDMDEQIGRYCAEEVRDWLGLRAE